MVDVFRWNHRPPIGYLQDHSVVSCPGLHREPSAGRVVTYGVLNEITDHASYQGALTLEPRRLEVELQVQSHNVGFAGREFDLTRDDLRQIEVDQDGELSVWAKTSRPSISFSLRSTASVTAAPMSRRSS